MSSYFGSLGEKGLEMDELIKNINALMEDYDFAREKIISIEFYREYKDPLNFDIKCKIHFAKKDYCDAFAEELGIKTKIDNERDGWTVESGSKDRIEIVRYER